MILLQRLVGSLPADCCRRCEMCHLEASGDGYALARIEGLSNL